MVTSTRQEFQLLITDDNAAFRQVLREVLEGRPFLILHEAESGEEAVDVVKRQRIDIVLLKPCENSNAWTSLAHVS
jgi:CheY-like chemotaxis protein